MTRDRLPSAGVSGSAVGLLPGGDRGSPQADVLALSGVSISWELSPWVRGH
jgi:hypothetical protein